MDTLERELFRGALKELDEEVERLRMESAKWKHYLGVAIRKIKRDTVRIRTLKATRDFLDQALADSDMKVGQGCPI